MERGTHELHAKQELADGARPIFGDSSAGIRAYEWRLCVCKQTEDKNTKYQTRCAKRRARFIIDDYIALLFERFKHLTCADILLYYFVTFCSCRKCRLRLQGPAMSDMHTILDRQRIRHVAFCVPRPNLHENVHNCTTRCTTIAEHTHMPRLQACAQHP